MKTRFTLTASALVSAPVSSTSAMTASNPAIGESNVIIKLTGACEVETNSDPITVINSDSHASAGVDINFDTHEVQVNSTLTTGKSTTGTGEGLNIECDRNTPLSIDFLPQNSGATTAGAGITTGVNLSDGSYFDAVKYQLYQPATSTGTVANNGSHTSRPWGNDKGTSAVDLIDKGLNDVIKVPVYADAPAGESDKVLDRHQDRVTASVSY